MEGIYIAYMQYYFSLIHIVLENLFFVSFCIDFCKEERKKTETKNWVNDSADLEYGKQFTIHNF